MTGFKYRKTRHYAKEAFGKQTRPDFDFRAILFSESQKALSSKDALDPGYSVKAAMPSQDSDGKKRTINNKKKSPYVNSRGMVYDPDATWAPGKYFKHYVTDAERIDALKMDEPNPNWGWLDENTPSNSPQFNDPKNDLTLIVETKKQNPRGDTEEKGLLGRTIGERNPGGKLAARAARAFGVVVDALGKFRCPPGTPAANQFTNERGENCFSISNVAQNMLASILASFLDGSPKDKSQTVSALLSAGFSYQEIRDAYESDGMRGLASLASSAGMPDEILYGDDYMDGSYRTSALQKILERGRQTDNTVARTRAKSQQRRELVATLFDRFSIEDRGDTASMVALVERLRDHGYFHPDFDGSSLFIGGTPESHEEGLLNIIFNSAEGLPLKRSSGDINLASGRIEEYKASKAAGEVTPLTQWVDAALEREQQYMRGTLMGIIHMTETRPDLRGMIYPTLFRKASELYLDQHTHAATQFWGDHLGGAGGYRIDINPVPALKGMPPMPGPGETMLYTADGGGSQEEQWRLIGAKLGEVDRMRTWANTHMTDLAATIGNGWEDFGAEVGIHEVIHVAQFETIKPHILRRTGASRLEDLTNEEIGEAMYQIAIDPDLSKEIFGVDIYDLVDRRLDALAGSYSAQTQQDALAILRQINAMPDGRAKEEKIKEFQKSVATAMYETLTELGAAREMGLIAGEDVDEVLEFMDAPRTAPISVPAPPSGPLTPTVSPRPSVPPDAPRPARPGSPGPAVPDLVDSTVSTEEVEEAWGLRPSSRRPAREKTYDAVRNRKGKVPQLIIDGRMTKEDVSDHVLGELDPRTGRRTGGIVGQIRSIRNMRDRDTEKNPTARRRRRILNDLLDSLPLDEDELVRIGLDEGPLSDEDRQKLEQTVEMLKNAAYDYKQKAEEAREKFRNYEGVDTSGDYNDRDANYSALEALDDEARMWDNLHNRIGRGLAASVNDIIDIRDNGPFPVRPTGRRPGSRPGPYITPDLEIDNYDIDVIRRSQEETRTPEENRHLRSSTVSSPRTGVILGPDGRELLRLVTEDAEVSRAFTDNGLNTPTDISTTAKEIDRSRLIISGIDKSEVKKEIVVEAEIDIPEDSVEFDLDGITPASPITNDTDRGMQSRGKLIAAGKILGSKRTQKLLEKVGIDSENAETVRVIAQMGIAFAAGGPAGVAAQILRMGSRDASLAALDRAIERGWIEPSTAARIRSMIIDRIAPDGIPDDVKQVLERSKDAIWTEENREKAKELSEVAHERFMDMTDAAREKVSEIASSAKEKTGSAISRVRERVKNRGDKEELGTAENNFPTTEDELPSPTSSESEYNPFDVFETSDPFKSLNIGLSYSLLTKEETKQLENKKRKQKANILLQPGQKAAFVKDKNGDNKAVLPPGKVKITSVNEDGSVDAEIVSQVDTEEYLKKLEEKFESLANDASYDIRSRAKENIQYSKKKRVENRMQKYSPPKSSSASKKTLEKSNGIMEDLSSRDINPFRPQYNYNYESLISDAISVIRAQSREAINTSKFDDKILDLLEKNSDTEIIELIYQFCIDMHNSFDRRARISLSPTEVNQLSRKGIISPRTNSPSLEKMMLKRDINRGIANESYSPGTISISLVSSFETDAIESLIYEHGTRVGSEEFYDSNRGFEIVLRPENSVRIGYSVLPNGIKPTYISLDEDDEAIIVGALLGNISEDSQEASEQVMTIFQSIVEKNYRYFIGTPGKSKIDSFVIGDISLNDIEHLKVPNSVLGYRGKRFDPQTPIFGENSLREAMKQEGVAPEKIDKFFAAGGTIGGGFSPRFISYFLEVDKARKMKERLISSGFADVIFTNKDGIDMMSSDSWGQSGIAQSSRGEKNLLKLATDELAKIIQSVSGKKEKQPKKEVAA